MDQKWNVKLGANGIHAENMIEVGVSSDDLVGLNCDIVKEAEYPFRFVAWIYDQCSRVRL
jgi:hypothetical protein